MSSASINNRAACRLLRTTVRIGTVVLLVAGICAAAGQKAKSKPCVISGATGLTADDSTDIRAVDRYEEAITNLLDKERFEELECIADLDRSSKARFSSGMWKLTAFYVPFQIPLQHQTEEDWKSRLDKVQRWVSQKPSSITARIALAQTYMGYAWDARGNGFSDNVSRSGWRLFDERVAEARRALEEASKLQAKCPGWYSAMQDVAQAQGWSVPDARALYESAIAFEPTYYSYYRLYAYFLLPKWYGETGDSEHFAEEAANRIGGEQGDIIYFEIAAKIICRCSDGPQISRMSWPRIQRGFAALEKQYGASLTNMNLIAFLAVRAQDAPLAYDLFKRIGEQWSRDIWGTQSYFKSSQEWAERGVPLKVRQHTQEEMADANANTPEGSAYRSVIEKGLTSFLRQCVQTEGSGDGRFQVLIRMSKDGAPDNVNIDPPQNIMHCLLKSLIRQPPPFPPPPQPSYWIRIELDPSTVARVTPN